MITISILKNDQVIHQYRCDERDYKRMFSHAVDAAGGLWNGVDQFKVVSNK